MSVKLPITLMLLFLTFALTACGSHEDSTRSSVSAMSRVIKSYNSARPTDLVTQGQACKTAYDALGKQSSSLASPSSPDTSKQVTGELRTAYKEARSAFLACATASSRLNFQTVTAANEIIQQANAAIIRAQSLDH